MVRELQVSQGPSQGNRLSALTFLPAPDPSQELLTFALSRQSGQEDCETGQSAANSSMGRGPGHPALEVPLVNIYFFSLLGLETTGKPSSSL